MSVSDLEEPKQENNKYLNRSRISQFCQNVKHFLAVLSVCADNLATFDRVRTNPAITLDYFEMFCVVSNFTDANYACLGL